MRKGMFHNFGRLLASMLCMCVCVPVLAQSPLEERDTTETSVTNIIPAGTLVSIRVDENLSSGSAKRGDNFPISLMNDLWVGDKIAVPMGTKGIGEVIHASGKGFGGRAGELIVTARHLEHDGRKIRLGHFKLYAAGSDNATTALIATAAAPIIGIFVTGTSAYIGLGQFAQAKVTENFLITDTTSSNTTAGTAVIKGEDE
jgi:hypothetical protein